jgi:hypothetical protein
LRGLIYVLATVLLTIVFGIALDMVTAHVAVEYFTVHHPPVVDSESPVVMALVWGVLASWWFGLIGAVIVWFVNSRKSRRVPWRTVLLWTAKAMAVLWLFMMAILVSVYLIGNLVPPESRRDTFEHDRRLMAVALTHMTEYVLGGIVVLYLSIRVAKAKASSGDDLA